MRQSRQWGKREHRHPRRGGGEQRRCQEESFPPPGPSPVPSRPRMKYPVQGNPSLPLLHCHLRWLASSGEYSQPLLHVHSIPSTTTSEGWGNRAWSIGVRGQEGNKLDCVCYFLYVFRDDLGKVYMRTCEHAYMTPGKDLDALCLTCCITRIVRIRRIVLDVLS